MFEVPADMMISPDADSILFPVAMVTWPELAALDVPEDSTIDPLAPSTPALRVRIFTAPLFAAVLPPDASVRSPPVMEVEDPAPMYTLPPIALFSWSSDAPLPTRMLMSPEGPSFESPVSRVMDPVCAVELAPVLMLTAPLPPSVPASWDATSTDPLAPEVDPPETKRKEPPVAPLPEPPETTTSPPALPASAFEAPAAIKTEPPVLSLPVLSPALTLTSPPFASPADPTWRVTSPEAPNLLSPDEIDTEPVAPASADPDLRSILPLDPFSPPLAVRRLSSPLERSALAPVVIMIAPPVKASLSPATRATSPLALVADPTESEIPPTDPSSVDPVWTLNAPDAPSLAVPVCNAIAPLEPTSPALGEEIRMEPLPASVLPPLLIDTDPPVSSALLPADTLTDPPTASPAEPPTEREMSPPLPCAETPDVKEMLPVLP